MILKDREMQKLHIPSLPELLSYEKVEHYPFEKKIRRGETQSNIRVAYLRFHWYENELPVLSHVSTNVTQAFRNL